MENTLPKIGDKVLIDNFTYGVVKESETPIKDGYLLVHIPYQPKASISGGRFLIQIKRLTVDNTQEFVRSMPVMGKHLY